MGKKHGAIKRVETIDKQVSRTAAAYRDTPAIRALGVIGELGDQPPMVALCSATTLIGLVRRDPHLVRAGLRMLAAHAVATGLKAVVKRSVDRTRPKMLVEEGRYETGKGERNRPAFNSFPSGHTAGAVAVARAFAHDYPHYRAGAYAGAATVAAVQLPRAMHFASDIVTGALIGLVAETAVSALVDRIVPDPSALEIGGGA